MTHAQILELRRQRAALIKQAQALMAQADASNRDLNPEEAQQWDRIHKDADELKARIDRAERQLAADASIADATPGARAGRADDRQTDEQRAQRIALANSAFNGWLRFGMDGLDTEQRQYMVGQMAALPAEVRAQSGVTGNVGGYTVPTDTSLYGSIESALKAYGGLLEAATIMDTDTGADLPIPTDNDTAQSGARLAENTQVAAQDITFGQVTLKAWMYTSKLILVPLQLVQDTAINLDSFIGDKAGTRIARIVNSECTTGTGSGNSQPNGIVTAATLGKTGANGQTTSVTYDDLVDLVHSVDPAYRREASFMFNDSVLKALKKLKDSQNRPLWLPGLSVREPDTINGYPYVINQDMANMAANAKSILFGALKKYLIRKVKGFQVLRLTERYADYLQIGFLAFARYDGQLLDAGTNPVKYYANSAA